VPEAVAPAGPLSGRPGIALVVVPPDRRPFLRAALIAGVTGAVLSALPFGLVLAMPAAGFLSVVLYRRQTAGEEPGSRFGFRLGALSGLFAFILFALLAVLDDLFAHKNMFRDAMIDAIHRQQARAPDAQTRQMLDYLLTPQGLMIMMVAGFICLCAAFVLLAALGGSLAPSLLKRKPRQ